MALTKNMYADQKQGKIVVVGAGLAGLTAAYRLTQQGCDVEVYEARPRVGGRVHTALIRNFDGGYSYAELGGQSLMDGGASNNILSLIKELEIETEEAYRDFSILFYDGQQFYDHHTVLSHVDFGEQSLAAKLEEVARSSSSMQDVLEKLFPGPSVIKRICTWFLIGYEGAHPSSLSLYHNMETLHSILKGGMATAHKATFENPKIYVKSCKKGNAQLPLKLAEKLEGKVHLNKSLRKLSVEGEKQLRLFFHDATSVVCDKVLLTIPASVYKDIVFDARVISPKQLQEIQAVHYAKNEKILTPISYQNLTHRAVATDDMIAFFNDDQRLLNIYFINNNGSHPRVAEIIEKQLPILKKGFNDALFPQVLPVAAKEEQLVLYDAPVVKGWVKDPYAQGAYSCFGTKLAERFAHYTDYKGVQVKEIFAPINNQVFFAGEHTTVLDEIGTMEAAVESGERTALILLKE